MEVMVQERRVSNPHPSGASMTSKLPAVVRSADRRGSPCVRGQSVSVRLLSGNGALGDRWESVSASPCSPSSVTSAKKPKKTHLRMCLEQSLHPPPPPPTPFIFIFIFYSFLVFCFVFVCLFLFPSFFFFFLLLFSFLFFLLLF